ncbi:hypothetical protein [Rossellomorea marisflavi]|uniref:hypothetical protein n=1 Tax=Rossellomorea marisflavi TaxID=189381 RepID=UPI00345C6924
MDPFTFAIVSTGAFGGGLILISALERAGVQINEDFLKIVMEGVKVGVLLKFMLLLSQLFL